MSATEVVIYTKSWCGYCHAAKRLLDQLNMDYEEIDVTTDQVRYREMVARADGRTSVPQIFIDGRGIGGYTDLYRLIQNNTA